MIDNKLNKLCFISRGDREKFMEYIKLRIGYRTALYDGTLVPESPRHMATEKFYHAMAGSWLHLCEKEYLFAPAIFSLERNPEYIYTYSYAKEENWSTYTQNLTPDSYQLEDYIFEKECYFRVCVRRRDGNELGEDDSIKSSRLVQFYHEEPEYHEKTYFQREVDRTIESIHSYTTSNMMKLCILADTHVTINGTWLDTVSNIQKVAGRVGYNGIIHLGDLTDGMVSKELTTEYVNNIINDLEKCGVPVYITPGNHDWNYFYNNDTFSWEEMNNLYHMRGEGLDYYVDLPSYFVRMIFLSSFEDSRPIRYGYTREQITWLKETLNCAPAGTKFLVFSHDAPLAKLDYWSFLIQNGEELLDVLETYNAKEEYQIIGLFYGHTHADYMFEECSFPVVSVGCAKLEYFIDKKPENAVIYERKAGTASQDLWDSLLIDFNKQKLKLVRFGAGKDREVSFAKKKSTYKKIIRQKRMGRKTKIWAHRGASGRAPENTLPAFELAWQIGRASCRERV